MGKLKGGAGGGASRKELRKAHKQAAKEKKQQRHHLKQVSRGWCACVARLSCWPGLIAVRLLSLQYAVGPSHSYGNSLYSLYYNSP